jgi:hypothetical protein
MEAPTNMGRKRQTSEGLGYGLRGLHWRGWLVGGHWRLRLGRRWLRFGCSGLIGWRAGWGWLCGLGELWNLTSASLKTGHYLLSEFRARGRQGSVRRWGRLWGWGKRRVVSGEWQVTIHGRLGGLWGLTPHRSDDRPLHGESGSAVVRVWDRAGSGSPGSI